MIDESRTAINQIGLPTKIGSLTICFSNNKITAIKFLSTKKNSRTALNHPLAKKAISQLKRYFANGDFKFSLPCTFTCGTPFEQKVWLALKNIKPGTTKTYQDLAIKLKTSPRAIGNALRKNPLPIVLPCHRVTAKNGIGGYSGATKGKLLNIKVWLLNHEKIS